jgi:hypothetical protein
MLVIREAQMEALRAHQRQQFEDAVVDHLLRRVGGEPVLLRNFVRAGILEALRIGLRTEDQILRWLKLRQWLEAHSDREPWAAGILSDSELAPGLKLRLLEDGANPAVES